MRIAVPLALLAALVGPALPAAAADEEECIDFAEHVDALAHLEPKAIRGGLSDVQITCLEVGYLKAETQTDKGKISRVLMANAYVTDTDAWARLVRRHLDEVEQSDPDIAYLYANHLYNKDDPDLEGVVRYARLSFERRADRWEGETYTRRSHHLLRLQTIALLELWKAAEEAASGTVPDSPERARAEQLRVRAHAAAREWLDFDRASEVPWLEAAQVCASTASEAACGLKSGWQSRAGG
jgi:hypothetical protein